MKPNKIASVVYNFLVKTNGFFENPYLGKCWNDWWKKGSSFTGQTVFTRIHGRDVWVDYGNMYPITARRIPTFNNPLLELVYQKFSVKKSRIHYVDVGASVGDTLLLLDSNCPEMMAESYAIEGDPELFVLLEHNVSYLKSAKLFSSYLSSQEGTAKNLVRTHGGSSSALGKGQVECTSLDQLFAHEQIEGIDILKTDVEGMDGKILSGAAHLLRRDKPEVIFEWHPIRCRQTGNDWHEAFQVLENQGYRTYIWFTKFGVFSHFMEGNNQKELDRLAEVCLNDKFFDDWHYDVIALHETSLISPVKLAEAQFSKRKKSVY